MTSLLQKRRRGSAVRFWFWSAIVYTCLLAVLAGIRLERSARAAQQQWLREWLESVNRKSRRSVEVMNALLAMHRDRLSLRSRTEIELLLRPGEQFEFQSDPATSCETLIWKDPAGRPWGEFTFHIGNAGVRLFFETVFTAKPPRPAVMHLQDRCERVRREIVGTNGFGAGAALWIVLLGAFFALPGHRRPLAEGMVALALLCVVACLLSYIWGTGGGRLPNLNLILPLLMLAMGMTLALFARRGTRKAALLPCAACGYDLAGNVSGVCPECGEAISKRTEMQGSVQESMP